MTGVLGTVQNYAIGWGDYLDQAIQQGSVTAELVTNQALWVGKRTLVVPNVQTSGLQDYDRYNKGFATGSFDVEDDTYTLRMDRGVGFLVDSAIVDETNQAASVQNLIHTFNTENAIPEVDAYRLSTLAQTASSEGFSTTEVITPSNVVSKLKDAIGKVRKFGTGNVITFVSSHVMTCLEMAEDFKRPILVASAGASDIETRVTSLDGVRLREVWAPERFATHYNFSNGFQVTQDAQALNFIVCVQPTIIAHAKINTLFLFPPGTHTEGDGWFFQTRLYHDLFRLKRQIGSTIASTTVEGSQLKNIGIDQEVIDVKRKQSLVIQIQQEEEEVKKKKEAEDELKNLKVEIAKIKKKDE